MKTEKIITQSGLELVIEKHSTEKGAEVSIQTHSHKRCLMHWGLRLPVDINWRVPPKTLWPKGSRPFDSAAVQTPFLDHDGTIRISFSLDQKIDFPLIAFALYFPEEDRWDNNHGQDYEIEIPKPMESSLSPIQPLQKESQDNFHISPIASSKRETSLDPGLTKIAGEIIQKETGNHSWTLMHRFKLCYGLLDRIGDDTDALALIFVWLRFSFIRQLDWQRNYNTQPRELSHALDRLTARLAERYINKSDRGQFIRLILTTLGRGGEGQRVRDEILNIMHRHHIKEVSGHFMEEWHQKLHNNTTPDDVVICEAYLSFLRSNGNLDLFYRTLKQGGVTKERLGSYDRPIKSHPDFIPHLKEALIHDFEEFLSALKGVHSGTDLGTAIHAAGHLLDQDMRERMDVIWRHRDDGPSEVCALAERITKARNRLTELLNKHPGGVRDLLFLDLALEDFLRTVVERSLHLKLSGDQLVVLIALMLENRSLTDDDKELSYCLRHWETLRRDPRFGKKWSLQAQSVLERIGRVIGGFIDRYYALLQPKAEFLGSAFQADPWTITLFTEEVVRGRPAFVLVMLLRHLNPILRKSADLGNWQIVSRGQGSGQVEVAESLGSIQNRRYDYSTVVVTDKIAGNEEIPPGVTAIITPDTTDIVSHVAIRARNAQVLIATCYDPEMVEHLKSLKGRRIELNVRASGEVIVEEGRRETTLALPHIHPVPIALPKPHFTAYAILERDFNGKNVGAKSNNLRRMRDSLPEWVHVPASTALPFGVFERVLDEKKNRGLTEKYRELIREVDQKADGSGIDLLCDLRKTVLELNAPDGLDGSIYQVMAEAGLTLPKDWNDAWMCIKRVWASKWNERAFLSRRARGIPHEDLFMAVLLQEVVDADYSFVIHTVNPLTCNQDEVYAEVVLGLGETLVGNYPGRACSFSVKKGGTDLHFHAFPSKSTGLFGTGLIFRSDSNGEDLAHYAGAGLYDSVMLPAPREILLDYSDEPLLRDDQFQREFLTTIADIGIIIEKQMGSAQDIEGLYSKDRYYVVQTRPQIC